MGKRQFAIKIQWSWDHTNTEVATFTIEGDAEEEHIEEGPLFINKPLDQTTFRLYFEKYQGLFASVLGKFQSAVNGNPMGRSNLVELYELANPASFKPVTGFLGLVVYPLQLVSAKPLCTFDDKGNVVFLQEDRS